MVSLLAVVALMLAGLFFGSQFGPQKFCQNFDSRAYNLSMMMGIAMVCGIMSLVSFVMAIPGDVAEKEFSLSNMTLCIMAGVIWSGGNLFILAAVYRIGISRTFPVVNLVIVMAFFAGIVFLGELRDINAVVLFILCLGIGSVLAGSYFTTKATSKEEKKVRDVKGGIIAAAVSVIFFGFYNIPILYSLRTETWSVYLAVFFLSMGAVLGGTIFGFLWMGKTFLATWKKAVGRWHLLAISGGMLWGAGQTSANLAMVEIGLSIGAPLIQGLVIVVGAVWGLAVFHELADISKKRRRKAVLILIFGCSLAIIGSVVMGFVAGLLF
ncbi:MAG: hypothetical protein JSW28_10530 [Thermoplasmata archaeon]|nr:MAG: hypothetical protein JSW28_10530 [Thermoplasmata archaeon]